MTQECWRILRNAPNSRCSNKVLVHPSIRQPGLPRAVDREWEVMLPLDTLGQRLMGKGKTKNGSSRLPGEKGISVERFSMGNVLRMNKAMKGAFCFEDAGVQNMQSRFMFGEGRQHFVFQDACDTGEVAFHVMEVVRHRLIFGGQHFLPMTDRFGDRLRFVRALINQVDTSFKRVRLLVQSGDLMLDGAHAFVELDDLVLDSAHALVELDDLVFDGAHAFVQLGDLVFDGAHALVQLGDLVFDSAHAFVQLDDLVLEVACPLVQLSELLLKGARPLIELGHLRFESARSFIKVGRQHFKGTRSFIEIGHLSLQGANPLLERLDRRARRFHFMQNFPQQRFHSFHLLFPLFTKTRADGEKK